MEYLVLTLEDLQTYQGQDFFYYCLWYLGSLEHAEFNISDALETQNAIIKHKPFDISIAEEFGLHMTSQVIKRRIKKIKNLQENLQFEVKRDKTLIVVALDVIYDVIKTLLKQNAGEPNLALGNLLKVWCCIWLVHSVGDSRHAAPSITQTRISEQAGISRNSCNKAISTLIDLKLITQYGKYLAGSFGYCYKVAEQHASYLKWYKNE